MEGRRRSIGIALPRDGDEAAGRLGGGGYETPRVPVSTPRQVPCQHQGGHTTPRVPLIAPPMPCQVPRQFLAVHDVAGGSVIPPVSPHQVPRQFPGGHGTAVAPAVTPSSPQQVPRQSPRRYTTRRASEGAVAVHVMTPRSPCQTPATPARDYEAPVAHGNAGSHVNRQFQGVPGCLVIPPVSPRHVPRQSPGGHVTAVTPAVTPVSPQQVPLQSPRGYTTRRASDGAVTSHGMTPLSPCQTPATLARFSEVPMAHGNAASPVLRRASMSPLQPCHTPEHPADVYEITLHANAGRRVIRRITAPAPAVHGVPPYVPAQHPVPCVPGKIDGAPVLTDAAPVYTWKQQTYSNLDALQQAIDACPPNALKELGIKELLSPTHKLELQTMIVELLQGYFGCDRRLRLHEMVGVVSCLAAALHIPVESLGDLNFLFYRYDFSGDERLDEEEAIMLIEGMLRMNGNKMEGGGKIFKDGGSIPSLALESQYDVMRQLGKGGQGFVWLALDKKDKQEKVVKVYNKKAACMELDDIIDEFAFLTRLKHQRIARVYDIFQDASNIYVVSEPYAFDLAKAPEEAARHGVEITVGWYAGLWKQACEGLVYLHREHVMHCDIKEQNVMISRTTSWAAPNVVLIDFGCAKNFTAAAKVGGTPGYMPPEVWSKGLWTTKGDTFALGVMMYVMLTRTRPFGATAKCLDGFKNDTLRCILPPTPLQLRLQPELNTLLVCMMQKEFRNRPTIKGVLENAFFKTHLSETPLDTKETRRLSCLRKKNDLHVALLSDFADKQNLSQLEEYTKIFSKLDVDHSGTLTADEARQGLASKLDATEIDSFIGAMMDDDGMVSYTQFMGHMMAYKHASNTQMLETLFAEIDTDQNGYLDLQEIHQMLQRPRVAEVMVGKCGKELMHEIDKSKDGKISWLEFRKYLNRSFESEQGPASMSLLLGESVELS